MKLTSGLLIVAALLLALIACAAIGRAATEAPAPASAPRYQIAIAPGTDWRKTTEPEGPGGWIRTRDTIYMVDQTTGTLYCFERARTDKVYDTSTGLTRAVALPARWQKMVGGPVK